ncbi:MAG: hypothetical protein EON58_02505 [Alphaproteobacteria bacterium]|nr:MAG: hypothetical protein EON58_02505 [Alphaproteobacteria bacterium]
MPVTKYRTLNGRMRGQTTSGVRTDYLTDALGSVTATVTASAAVENTYRHKPYGGQLSKTGTGPDPRFLWTGDTGSRTTGASHAEQYNRARHYGGKQAGWTSIDPLWPEESPYGYVNGKPTTWIDPTGDYSVEFFRCKGCGKTALIVPDAGDKSAVVVGPVSKDGKHTGLIGGSECFKNAPAWAKDRKCVCVNGSFFYGRDPIGPLEGSTGPRTSGCGQEVDPQTITTKDGFITGSMRPINKVPTAGGKGTGRTGACVSKNGKLVGLLVSEACNASNFYDCGTALCPLGSQFVWLDGSGSSQVWEKNTIKPVPVIGGHKSGTGKPDWRPVDNWILICQS